MLNAAHRKVEENLLQILSESVSPEAYPEIARIVLQYGSASLRLGEAMAKQSLMESIGEWLEENGGG